jgi:hypothetical protein
MGRNTFNGIGSNNELLRLYTQVSKTPLGASATATASFDPLTFGSLTSQSIYSSSPNAFISASRASFNFVNDIPPIASIRTIQPITNDIGKSGSDLEVYTPSPYTSSIDAREFRYIVWDATNEIFY